MPNQLKTAVKREGKIKMSKSFINSISFLL